MTRLILRKETASNPDIRIQPSAATEVYHDTIDTSLVQSTCKMCFQLDVGAHSLVNLAFERSKQENHHESEVSLGYRVKPFLKDKQTEQPPPKKKNY